MQPQRRSHTSSSHTIYQNLTKIDITRPLITRILIEKVSAHVAMACDLDGSGRHNTKNNFRRRDKT